MKKRFSPASFYQWRAKFGGMEAEDAKRLKELEGENNRLKKMLAEAHLGIEAVCELSVISERRACSLAGLSRDAFRHAPAPSSGTQALSARLVELAHRHRRFGYRRLHDLVKPEFPNV